jgi:exodeoxyribonuclease-3
LTLSTPGVYRWFPGGSKKGRKRPNLSTLRVYRWYPGGVTVATFNVNSVRARLPVLIRWLEAVRPTVVGLQETKVEDDKFPGEEFERLGYHVEVHGQPKYNGVALLSLAPMESVARGFGDPAWPDDRRIIQATVNGWAIVNTYVPNGTAVGGEKWVYKLTWLERFAGHIQSVRKATARCLWIGDVNIAPTSDDVFDPERHRGGVGFHPEEHARLAQILRDTWSDQFRRFTQGSGHYTYWEFVIPNGFKRNLGWRIDHVYCPRDFDDEVLECWIDREPRGWERPSDHTPVLVRLR